jgi:hypothetical protein
MTARTRRARVLGICFAAALYAATGDGNSMLGAVLAAIDWLKPSDRWSGGLDREAAS